MTTDEIYEQVLDACLPYAGVPFDGNCPSLPNCSLLEMLQAVAEVGARPAEVLSDGTKRIAVIPDQGLVAYVYLRQRGGMPAGGLI